MGDNRMTGMATKVAANRSLAPYQERGFHCPPSSLSMMVTRWLLRCPGGDIGCPRLGCWRWMLPPGPCSAAVRAQYPLSSSSANSPEHPALGTACSLGRCLVPPNGHQRPCRCPESDRTYPAPGSEPQCLGPPIKCLSPRITQSAPWEEEEPFTLTTVPGRRRAESPWFM